MVAGLLTMAVGALLFVPAAIWSFRIRLFLTALLVSQRELPAFSVGQSLRDLLGKPETASSRLDLTQAFQFAWYHDRPENRRSADS